MACIFVAEMARKRAVGNWDQANFSQKRLNFLNKKQKTSIRTHPSTVHEAAAVCDSPRLCFLTSRASSVANKVLGKRIKIFVLEIEMQNDV